jgi:geranylgeranyl diphosphate synthase type II
MIAAYQPFYQLLESSLNELSQNMNGKPTELYEPQRYILTLGGKRIRPLLALVACDLFNQPVKNAVAASLAVELFHNFSLIHDDIMDNAPIRRGKKTVHEKWNHNIAILSGDDMLVKAYEVLCQSPSDKLKDLLGIFTKTAHEVCEGQQLDMNFETLDKISLAHYTNMIELKTAVLLGCSLKLGAIIGGADKENQDLIYQFGKELGIAFQIHDDLLDAFPNDENFGKQIGGDILSDKKTFLLIKSLEVANENQLNQFAKWINNPQAEPKEKISAIRNLYLELGIPEYCKQQTELHYQNAISSLKKIKANPEKINQLLLFAEELMNRKN